MPKDNISSSCRRRASPYSRSYKNGDIGNEREYEEARCPVCMEHPHNAVLLLCSSHEKGCSTYMCNTSSRLSNCFDQFRKSTVGEQTKLVCPLCRGQVNGWTVVNPARQFMNSKTRTCSLGTCDFIGNYSQLKEHARCVHPRLRPTDVDPERELEWRTLEEDMEQQDIFGMQFEFDDNHDDGDDATEFMDGVSVLASLISDFDYPTFLSTVESDLENVLSELFSALDDTSLFLDDALLYFSSAYESEIQESSGSRGTDNRLLGQSTENDHTTRRRTPMHVRQRSNSQPSSHNLEPGSHNHQEQLQYLHAERQNIEARLDQLEQNLEGERAERERERAERDRERAEREREHAPHAEWRKEMEEMMKKVADK